MQNQLDQVIAYIKQDLDQGISEAKIRNVLHQYGWPKHLVDQAFAAVHTAPHQPAAHHQPETSHHSVAPKKYIVFKAIFDGLMAIKNNSVNYILTVLLSYIAAGIGLAIVALIGVALIFGRGGFGLSSSSFLIVVIGALILYTFWFAIANAFILASTSLAIYNGSHKRKEKLSSLLKTAKERFGRVLNASLLSTIVIFWPIVFLFAVPLFLIFGNHSQLAAAAFLLLLSNLAALTWFLIASLRYALVPYVALFEPHVPVTGTLKRSRHLLNKGGQWFLVKGFLLLLLFIIAVSLATGKTLNELKSTGNIFINLLFIVVSLIMNSTLVMLYLNRKAIRS